jgi:hypothetical protein
MPLPQNPSGTCRIPRQSDRGAGEGEGYGADEQGRAVKGWSFGHTFR